MSNLVDHEGRPYENLVRASVSADVGNLIMATVPEDGRALIEEAVIALAHDMLEVGQTLGRGDANQQSGNAYLRGMFDTFKIIFGEK